MGIKVTIGDSGHVQTPSTPSALVVPATTSVTGVMPGILNVVSMSVANNALVGPGFYNIPGLNATATLPPPSAQPGAMYIITQTPGDLGPGAFVTSSNPVTSFGGATAFFNASGSITVNAKTQGVNLFMPKFGTVGLMSDGKIWNVLFCSGTLTLT